MILNNISIVKNVNVTNNKFLTKVSLNIFFIFNFFSFTSDCSSFSISLISSFLFISSVLTFFEVSFLFSLIISINFLFYEFLFLFCDNV